MEYHALNRLRSQEVPARGSRLLVALTVLLIALIQSGCVAPANLGVSPGNLNFGNVPIGSSSSQSVTVTNSSNAAIMIIQAAASGNGFDIKGPSLPLTLAAGESTTFTTTFTPSATGNASGSVLIKRSQAASPQLQSGTGSATMSFTFPSATIGMTGDGVPVAPSITTQPVSQAVTLGQAATFAVAASGVGPLSYQWKKNGTSINGATLATYTILATTTSDGGSQLSVVVSNSTGNVTSNVAILTVNAAGQLTASTTNLSYGKVITGSNNTLPVTLTNSGSSSVSISNVTLSGAGLSIEGASSGAILAAGNSEVLNVSYAPSVSGNLSGSVTITSNASDPSVTIALSGTAVPPVQHSVALGLAPGSSNVVGYNVYRSSTSNGPYIKLNSPLVTSTSYTDATVLANQSYFYVGTSVDSAGNETAYSNQVSATIPTP